jgi:hypothetical protein
MLPPEIWSHIFGADMSIRHLIARVSKTVAEGVYFPVRAFKDSIMIQDFFSLKAHTNESNGKIAYLAAKLGAYDVLKRYFIRGDFNLQREIMYELGYSCYNPDIIVNIKGMCDGSIVSGNENLNHGFIAGNRIPHMMGNSDIRQLYRYNCEEYANNVCFNINHRLNEYKRLGQISNQSVSFEKSSELIEEIKNSKICRMREIGTAIADKRCPLLALKYAHYLHHANQLTWREHIRDDYLDVIKIMITFGNNTALICANVSEIISYCENWGKQGSSRQLRELLKIKTCSKETIIMDLSKKQTYYQKQTY